ncbi:MAG TPA: hypothetical protein VM537_35885 [Anaerolineae bacterium]|nr:hypothetical protein [Anaerolineae bacterium]
MSLDEKRCSKCGTKGGTWAWLREEPVGRGLVYRTSCNDCGTIFVTAITLAPMVEVSVQEDIER